MEFPESQKPAFKMKKQWKQIAKSEQERYVHANNHIIKTFRGEQTLKGEVIGIT